MTKPVIKTLSEVIAAHTDDPANPHGGGAFATCTCGAVYDWMPDHLQDVILKECFPHLSAVHAELVSKERGFLTKAFYKRQYEAYEAQQDDLAEFTEDKPEDSPLVKHFRKRGDDPNEVQQFVNGYKEAQSEVQAILNKHDM